jgi:LPS export ABC transporter protein LptC
MRLARPRERVGAASRAAFAGLGLVALVLGCTQEPAEQGAPAPGDQPAQVFSGLTLRESEGGRLRWVLQADSAVSQGQNNPTVLHGIRVEFYNAAGDSVRSTLVADEGEVTPKEKQRDLLARGHVIVRTPEGHTLETEELRWDHAAGKVISNDLVRLTRGESVLTGVGIESDPELRAYRILSEVEAGVREGEPILDDF